MGVVKLRVLLVDGTGGFTPYRLASKPTGGICTSLTLIPSFLSRMGIECYVKSIYEEKVFVNGVQYLPFNAQSPDVDIVVLNRNALNHKILSRFTYRKAKVIWWLHDMVDHRYLDDGAYRELEYIVSLSDYCTESYSEFYGIPKEKFHKIPNGIDPGIWYPGDWNKRDPNLFVYASSPTKGFAISGFAFVQIKRHLPNAVYAIYGNQSLHDLDNTPMFKRWCGEMSKIGAQIKEPIPQKALADVFRKAWALLMPNDYPEMCSNLMLQARACGLPVVTTPVGSASEWIEDGETGLLAKRYPHDKFLLWADYARKIMSIVADHDLHRYISENAPKGVPTWTEVSEKWYKYVTKVNEQAQLVNSR